MREVRDGVWNLIRIYDDYIYSYVIYLCLFQKIQSPSAVMEI